ncbi:MAG: MBL fold metallo-hydrolase [Candidatus Aenigmatarchaeota archaeon]
MKLSFYGGVNEIGGNKFLLEDKETKIFLDFGKNFMIENRFFDFPLVQPFYIPDLEKTGAIPAISSLYRDANAPYRKAGTKPVDGILLTHAHMDHYGYIPLIRGDVPIFLGKATVDIINIRSETYAATWGSKTGHIKHVETFHSNDLKECKNISFKPVHVDHSIPASYAYIIYGTKTVAYTGDLRLHGYKKELTKDFIAELEKNEVDVLLCEGTNIVSERDDLFLKNFEQELMRRKQNPPKRTLLPCKSEDEVLEKMKGIVNDMRGLVIIETNPADIDRIRTIFNVASLTKRKLVLTPKQSYLVHALEAIGDIKELPKLNDFCLYLDRVRKRQGEEWEEAFNESYRQDYQRTMIDKCKDVLHDEEGREELRKNGDEYIICTDNATKRFQELKPTSGTFPCNYILSKSEPFTEEMMITFDKLLNWLIISGITEYHQLHVSGHASKDDLKKIIDAANPKTIIPIHTEHPELFKKFGNVRIPTMNGMMEI